MYLLELYCNNITSNQNYKVHQTQRKVTAQIKDEIDKRICHSINFYKIFNNRYKMSIKLSDQQAKIVP